MNDINLKYVYKSLLWWIFFLSAIYLIFISSIYFEHILEIGEILNPKSENNKIIWGTFNKSIFNPLSVGITACSCFILVMIMILITSININSNTFAKTQFILFTISNIVLLGIYIGTTGCFLNSPFSGAIAVYLANIISLYDYSLLSKMKSILIISAIFVFSIFVLLFPYYLSFRSDRSLFIFEWSNDNYIVILRLVFTIAILIISTISSYYTSQKLSEVKSL